MSANVVSLRVGPSATDAYDAAYAALRNARAIVDLLAAENGLAEKGSKATAALVVWELLGEAETNLDALRQAIRPPPADSEPEHEQ